MKNQDAEDPQSEWWKFCRGETIVMYAFAVFGGCNKSIINLMAKTLDDAGNDTGILDDKKNSRTIVSIRKRGLPALTPVSVNHANDENSNKKLIHEHVIVRSDNEKEDASMKFAMEASMMLLTNPLFDDEGMKANARRNLKLIMTNIYRKALGPIVPAALEYDL